MHFRNRLSLSVSLAALVIGAPALAADVDFSAANLPAVSGLNGKVGLFVGVADGLGIPGIAGSLSLPVDHQYGIQLDGLVAASNGSGAFGIGGHFFWRDPSQGLLGLYAGYVHRGFGDIVMINGVATSGESTGKVGFEGEAYMGNISFEGFAGYQFGTNTGFAGKATVAYYSTPDLRIDLSVRHLVGPGLMGSIGLEWQAPASSMSFFADAGVGDNTGAFGTVGIKFYSGAGQKSLIQRHREDDPENELPKDLFGIIGDGVCPVGAPPNDGSACGQI